MTDIFVEKVLEAIKERVKIQVTRFDGNCLNIELLIDGEVFTGYQIEVPPELRNEE